MLGTTFRTFPSFPQRYIDVLPPSMQPETPSAVRIQTLKTPATPTRYTDQDLVTRQFLDRATRRIARRETRRDRDTLRLIERPHAGGVDRAAATQRR